MKIFLTGATGYIGGSLACRLIEMGHEVHGLVRSQEKADALEHLGVQPVIGTLDENGILIEAAQQADAVFNIASHRGAVEALIQALDGSEKPFIHTSGSSIVCDDARGDALNQRVYHDDSFIQPIPVREARFAIDRFVRSAGITRGVRTIVLCPTMIYGAGHGLQKDSDQVPKLMKRSLACGAGIHIGKGLNRWSNGTSTT